MTEMLNVTLDGRSIEVRKGTRLLDVCKEYKSDDDEADIVLALVNGKLRELSKTIKKSCTIEFVSTKDENGKKTYARGMILVLIKAVYDVLGKENIEKFTVEFSLGEGYYCELKSNYELNEELIKKLKNRMSEIVDADMPFVKKSIATDEARELFGHCKMYEKEKLFKYRRVSKANIYSLGNIQDYFYGYMPFGTGILKYFDLHLYEDGLILQVPSTKTPRKLDDYSPLKKLFLYIEGI